HVARSVVVAPPEMVPILGFSRSRVFEEAIEIGDGARLVLDGRHASGRSHDEDRGDAGVAFRLGDGMRHQVRDVVAVALSAGADFSSVGRNHGALAYCGWEDAVIKYAFRCALELPPILVP